MYLARTQKIFLKTYSALLFFTTVLLCARLFMFENFVDAATLSGFEQDVKRMWWIGLRFDLRVAATAAIPLFLFGLLFSFSNSLWRIWKKAALAYTLIAAFVIVFLAISNYFYYQTFHRPFDIFLFGLVEDDTKNVFINIWDDYPVIKVAFLTLFATTLAFCGFRWRLEPTPPKKRWPLYLFISYLLSHFFLLFALARGSLGVFPLDRPNAQVSQLVVLNQLTPNAFMALSWALEDKKEDFKFNRVQRAEGKSLVHGLNFDSLYAETATNAYLASNPPHVIFTLMESFGSNMLVFDDKEKNDLLGALRTHFAEDFVFKRFVSFSNGTAPSLAQLFFNSPVHNISQSSARNAPLDTPFKTFKKAGYKTAFVTPGNTMWRNLVNYLPRQGVDQVYDQNAIMARFPEAKAYMADWGLPDEYAFKFVEDLLAKTDGPLFVSILTITNHPPYATPSSYKPYPVAATPDYEARTGDGQIETKNILTTFQYAANALGEFVSHIKKSPLAQKTIIAATGDHSLRRVKARYPRELMLDNAVPLYLYVPQTILHTTHSVYDANRVGSHKDIMPTLFSLSLSNQKFMALGGRNILAKKDSTSMAFGYNETLWIDNSGAYTTATQSVFYPWENKESLYLSSQGSATTASVQKRISQYPRLLRWNLNRQVAGLY